MAQITVTRVIKYLGDEKDIQKILNKSLEIGTQYGFQPDVVIKITQERRKVSCRVGPPMIDKRMEDKR